MAQHRENRAPGQASVQQAEALRQLRYVFVRPVLCRLHKGMDRCLVQTLLDLVQVIVMHRHRQQGLVLSELGGHLLRPAQAPAGTKRIDQLLKSLRWQAATLLDYLWEKEDEAVQRLTPPQDDIYVIWDESVIEKPESLKAERLGPVRSSKARRLLRIKPGYYMLHATERSGLCARLELAAVAGGGAARTSDLSASALVDDPWRGSQRQAD